MSSFYDQMRKKLQPRTVDPRAIEAAEDLGLKELAVLSGLSVKTLREYLTHPQHPLPHHRIGGRVLVNKARYRAWREQFTVDEAGKVNVLIERAVGGKKALEAARERLAKAKKGARS